MINVQVLKPEYEKYPIINTEYPIFKFAPNLELDLWNLKFIYETTKAHRSGSY